MTERSDNAKAAAKARREALKAAARKAATAFKAHPGSTPAGHRRKDNR